jgi:hypothetical protein
MLRLYSIQVSFGYIFSFARSDSFGHIYTTILLMLICSRKGHFRPELSTHPDNAGYTQDLDQILISNSPEMYPGRILCRKTQGQYRNVPVSVAVYNLKSSVFLQKRITFEIILKNCQSFFFFFINITILFYQ